MQAEKYLYKKSIGEMLEMIFEDIDINKDILGSELEKNIKKCDLSSRNIFELSKVYLVLVKYKYFHNIIVKLINFLEILRNKFLILSLIMLSLLNREYFFWTLLITGIISYSISIFKYNQFKKIINQIFQKSSKKIKRFLYKDEIIKIKKAIFKLYINEYLMISILPINPIILLEFLGFKLVRKPDSV